jgi:hypothetical protein
MQRYILGATLFGLIWASIAYTQQGVNDPVKLIAGVLVFVVLGTTICTILSYVVKWFKNQK